MSSEIYTQSARPDVKCGRHTVVSTLRKQELSDFIERERHKEGRNWGYRTVAQRSRGLLSHSTVGDLINKKYESISTDIIKGLAYAFGVEETAITEVAFGKPERNGFVESDFARLYFKHTRLKSKARQKEFERIYQMVERDYDRLLLEDEADNKGDK